MAASSAELADAALQLKTELFGIHDVIDRVLNAIRAWYVLPQPIPRPFIVCLGGLPNSAGCAVGCCKSLPEEGLRLEPFGAKLSAFRARGAGSAARRLE